MLSKYINYAVKNIHRLMHYGAYAALVVLASVGLMTVLESIDDTSRMLLTLCIVPGIMYIVFVSKKVL